MRTTRDLATKFLFLLTAIGLLYSGILGFSVISSPIDKPDLLSGITLAGATTEADALHLRKSLKFLHDYLPEWHTFVADAKPFVLSIGQTDNEGWVAASSSCCDPHGNGRITFDDHLGFLIASDDPADQTDEARQVHFLSVLIHEVTHLRDYRAGQMPAKMNAAGCIASEGAAYTKEFEFKRALASAGYSNSKTGANYRTAAKRQFEAEEKQFNNKVWKLYCIIAYPNTMDD